MTILPHVWIDRYRNIFTYIFYWQKNPFDRPIDESLCLLSLSLLLSSLLLSLLNKDVCWICVPKKLGLNDFPCSTLGGRIGSQVNKFLFLRGAGFAYWSEELLWNTSSRDGRSHAQKRTKPDARSKYTTNEWIVLLYCRTVIGLGFVSVLPRRGIVVPKLTVQFASAAIFSMRDATLQKNVGNSLMLESGYY